MRSVFLDASVDEAEALRYLGYAGQCLDEGLAERFRDAASKVNVLRPRGLFCTFPVDAFLRDQGDVPCAVKLQGTSFVLPGRDIAAHLRGAREAVLMAVTLGLESEMLLRREMALSKTDGMLAHACASSLVECAANELSRMVELAARDRGFESGARFSPGYGDFPLHVQPEFLSVLNAGKMLGLNATEANMLVPSKSITAICGLFDSENHGADCLHEGAVRGCAMNACEACPRKSACSLREQGRTCYGS